jgi:hypothetical protein
MEYFDFTAQHFEENIGASVFPRLLRPLPSRSIFFKIFDAQLSFHTE